MSTRLISGMLYGVSPLDPFTLSGVIVLVTAVAALAALLPAIRASRLNPVEALRE
jgi:ABC-type antimicrobial peptide transport system permease subunit